MLTELPDLQESDESLWGCSSVSFTIDTRSEEGNELVQRTYTFSHAPEWDKWTFSEFEERRTEDTEMVTDRNWRRSRHVMWQEAESRTIDVPPEVTAKLEELLGVDEITIQVPS